MSCFPSVIKSCKTKQSTRGNSFQALGQQPCGAVVLEKGGTPSGAHSPWTWTYRCSPSRLGGCGTQTQRGTQHWSLGPWDGGTL